MPIERGVSTDEKQFACGAIFTPASLFARSASQEGGAFLFYQEAVNYIKNIERSGSKYGIERMRELLILLGEPDCHLKFVHVAGTNGKGSVCAYLTSILRESGYKVGTYNSPSVFKYNERWLIDGQPLDDESVAKYLAVVKETIENEQTLRRAFGAEEFCPTAFEIETAVAFLAFYDNDCDICVLETGLGGRWDATNVIYEKEIAVITPIGLDHCAILGDTVADIAKEKAAIAKDVAVSCEQADEIMRELAHPFDIVDGKPIYRNVRLEIASKPEILSSNADGQTFEYNGKKYRIGMLGEHQTVNASIAICAALQLRKKHWQISDEAIVSGLEKAVWRARLEIVKNAKEEFNITVPQDKVLIFDGSHNTHGAKTLADTLSKLFADKRIHLVMGVLKDKDVRGIVSTLAPVCNEATCITPPSARAMEKEDLLKTVSEFCDCVRTCDNTKVAVQNALNGSCDVVVLCGSLTLFADL